MKSEKGEVLVLGIFLMIFLVVIMVLIIMLCVYIVKEESEFGTKEGFVIDKDYNGAYTTMIYAGKVIVPQYHPASWKIKIQKEVKGENKALWVEVDETTYHSLNIGDFYPKEEK